jgi:hypothetical protein
MRHAARQPLRHRHGHRMVSVAVAVLMAGCGPQETDLPVPEPTVGSVGTLEHTKALLLPLDAYMFSLKEYRLLGEAQRLLLRRCMQRFGISYQTPAAPPLAGIGIQTRNERRYLVTDTTEARRYGYRVPTFSNREPPRSPQDDDPRVVAVLTGEGGGTSHNTSPVPSGGCVGESQRLLRRGAPDSASEDIAEPMAMRSWEQSAEDSRVRAVFARWSECMQRAGFRYGTPLEPARDRQLQARLSPAQINTAVADTICKKRHNVIGVWAAVEAAYQRRLIEANKPALEALRAANAAQLRSASAVVGHK